MINSLDLLLRLSAACILGGTIGMQREGVNRPAGFRTHVLVAIGSSLIMLISMYGFQDVGRIQDPARIAAQVVSGIGFLGAGTIMREGSTVKGLTTAASLWVVAGIGLACGSGFYLGALATTALVYVVLATFSQLERYIFHKSQYLHVQVVTKDEPGQLGRIGAALGENQVSIRNICLSRTLEDGAYVDISLELKLSGSLTPTDVVDRLGSIPNVTKVDFS